MTKVSLPIRGVVVATVLLIVGVALMARPGGFYGSDEARVRCKGKTAQVEFQAEMDRVLPVKIEYLVTGGPYQILNLSTRSWVEEAGAVACPGKAELIVRNQQKTGEVRCVIWVNEDLAVDRTERDGDKCFVRVRLISAK